MFGYVKKIGENFLLSDAKVDSHRDLILAGTILNSLALDSTVTNVPVTLTSDGLGDILILKFNTAGQLIWYRQMGTYQFEWPSTMVIDKDDNVYVMGGFGDTLDIDPGAGIYNLNGHNATMADIFILKLNAAGNFCMG